MSELPYSKRKVNMMRVNAIRKEGSIAKQLFIAFISGTMTLNFNSKNAENYPEDYYIFKRIIEHTPSIEKLHSQINMYRASQILELLGTSVDNKKLSFLKDHKDPFSNISTQNVLDIIRADLDNYRLLLDAFICHRHRKAIRNLRIKIKKELGMTNEEIKPYRIYMTIPDSLLPFINAYKNQKHAIQQKSSK